MPIEKVIETLELLESSRGIEYARFVGRDHSEMYQEFKAGYKKLTGKDWK